jgi:hypothetical protein
MALLILSDMAEREAELGYTTPSRSINTGTFSLPSLDDVGVFGDEGPRLANDDKQSTLSSKLSTTPRVKHIEPPSTPKAGEPREPAAVSDGERYVIAYMTARCTGQLISLAQLALRRLHPLLVLPPSLPQSHMTPLKPHSPPGSRTTRYASSIPASSRPMRKRHYKVSLGRESLRKMRTMQEQTSEGEVVSCRRMKDVQSQRNSRLCHRPRQFNPVHPDLLPLNISLIQLCHQRPI